MFKFEIIEPTQRIFRNKLVKLTMEKMKFFQGIEFPSQGQGPPIFIIAEGQHKKIFGGACLLRKNLDEIQEDVRELVTTLTFHSHYIWECSTIYLDSLSQYPGTETPETALFSQNFYRKLYEKFVEFGTKQKVSFIIMKLLPEVYMSTKKFGLWPYVVELKPQNSPDGLFHGILPLTGSQYNAYQNTWKT